MKKFLLIALVSVLVLGLVSCKSGTSDKDGNDTTENDITTNTPLDTDKKDDTPNLTEGQSISDYMAYLVQYFHEPYSAGDEIPNVNLLYLMFLHSFYNRDSLDFVEVDDVFLNVKNSGLQDLTKKMFGDHIDLTAFHDKMNGATTYNQDTDKYKLSYATDYWGGDFFYINSEKELDIKEEGNLITVICETYESPMLFSDEKSNFRTMKYVFSKTSYNNVIFYRLESISQEK